MKPAHQALVVRDQNYIEGTFASGNRLAWGGEPWRCAELFLQPARVPAIGASRNLKEADLSTRFYVVLIPQSIAKRDEADLAFFLFGGVASEFLIDGPLELDGGRNTEL